MSDQQQSHDPFAEIGEALHGVLLAAPSRPLRKQVEGALAALDALQAQAEATTETCPDCGIPAVWCRRVSSNTAHCWRWDYEQFDTKMNTAESERDRLTELNRILTNDYNALLVHSTHEAEDLRAERDRLRDLLGRIRQWDHLDGAGDGPYWKREIDAALAGEDK